MTTLTGECAQAQLSLKRLQATSESNIIAARVAAEQSMAAKLADSNREKAMLLEQLKGVRTRNAEGRRGVGSVLYEPHRYWVYAQASRALQTLRDGNREDKSKAAGDAVRAEFLQIPREQQLATIVELLDQLGHKDSVKLCARILGTLSGDTSVSVVSAALNNNGQVTVEHLEELIRNLLDGPRVAEQPGGRTKLVNSTVHVAMKSVDRDAVVNTAVEDLTQRQRQGLMRFVLALWMCAHRWPHVAL